MIVPYGTRQFSVFDFVSKALSALSFWKDKNNEVADLTMTPFEAMKELEKRRKDPTLQKKVEAYLSGDVPKYFKEGPILYLARHIITPNFETLRFLYLTRHLGLKTVVSHDSKSLFVSQNQVKRALCKLPICRRVTQKHGKLNEQYQNVTVVDFNVADGKIFSEIQTIWGERLIDFHARLFSELGLGKVETPDDAAWLDRHHRNNLFEHYKQLLALFVVHGIFFENYNTDDEHEVLFVKQILRPACRFIEKRFGYRPIIVPIFPTSFESYRFWISYPGKVLNIVRESIQDR